MIRASKAEVKRRAKGLRSTTRALELALADNELEAALELAAHAFEEARALEYATRALKRKQGARTGLGARR